MAIRGGSTGGSWGIHGGLLGDLGPSWAPWGRVKPTGVPWEPMEEPWGYLKIHGGTMGHHGSGWESHGEPWGPMERLMPTVAPWGRVEPTGVPWGTTGER